MQSRIWMVGLLALVLTGCVTARGNQSSSQMQTRIGELEQEVSAKDEEIKELQYTIKDLTYEIDRAKTYPSRAGMSGGATSGEVRKVAVGPEEIIRINVDPKQVQTALKNAGYYSGNIDGKPGAQTKKAISSFQKDNGLNPDGLLGQKTWAELKKHL